MISAELVPPTALAAPAVDEVVPAGLAEPPASPTASPETRRLDGMLAQVSDLRCGSCGYGIASYVTPPVCPMCRETNWQPVLRPRPQ